MNKVGLSIILGFLAPFVYIIGAAPFEVRGVNSVKETLAGCIALALYLAICQFLVARKNGRTFRVNWPILVAMVATLLAMCLLIAALEHLTTALPVLLSGCVGCLAGALAAALGTRRVHPKAAQG